MKRKANSGTKALEKVVREERSLMNELVQMLNAERLSLSPYQMRSIAGHLKKKSQTSIDVGYIRTVLFPEFYSYDIPQPLSNISYSRFTDKQEAVMQTGNDGVNGAGIMLWFPKVNSGPSLFVYRCTGTDLDSALPVPFTNVNQLDSTKWTVGFIQTYEKYFQQTCLVAASISIQYVGTTQTESGFFLGGSVFTNGINTITVDDVENSQFKVLSQPRDGVRLLYLPKDATDYTYYPCRAGTSHNTGNPNANEDQFVLPKANTYNSISTPNTVAGKYTPPVDITYMNNSSCLAIYWKALPKDQNVLRVDAVRKYNGVPLNAIRDIVDLSRPKRTYDAKKTSDVIGQLTLSVPELGGHSIKKMDAIGQQIKEYLPNIGHMYASGGFRDSLSLDGLTSALKLQQSGLDGPSTMSAGRIWDD